MTERTHDEVRRHKRAVWSPQDELYDGVCELQSAVVSKKLGLPMVSPAFQFLPRNTLLCSYWQFIMSTLTRELGSSRTYLFQAIHSKPMVLHDRAHLSGEGE